MTTKKEGGISFSDVYKTGELTGGNRSVSLTTSWYQQRVAIWQLSSKDEHASSLLATFSLSGERRVTSIFQEVAKAANSCKAWMCVRLLRHASFYADSSLRSPDSLVKGRAYVRGQRRSVLQLLQLEEGR